MTQHNTIQQYCQQKMNNPFTSQRSLFTNIQKTKPPSNNSTQQASSLPPNRNISPINSQPTDNTNFNINTNSNVNTNIGGNSYSNINSYRNANTSVNSINSGNARVGFNRGGEDGVGQGSGAGYSAGVNPKQDQIKDQKIDLNFRSQFRQAQQNNINSYSKLPQNPTYTQYPASSITSSTPSMTIPASTQKLSSGYQSVNKQQQIQSQVKNNYQPPQTNTSQGSQSNQGGFQGRGDSFGAGVEKQKITFGVGSATGGDTKIQYDRAKFINREELVASGSSHNYLAQNPSSGTKQMASITMSPIQQHSKHKFDDTSQQFLDLDAMGDDIDKILASSKNQQELCRLLGIEGSGSNFPSNNSRQAMSQEQNTPYNRAFSNDVPTKSQDTNFVKKASMPNSQDPYTHLNYSNTKQRERDMDQVFNYQAPTQPQQPPYKPTKPQQVNPISTSTTSIKNQQSFENLQPNITNQNQEIHGQANAYTSELQQAINLEMKKLSYVNKGKVRVFLSASERIETVKCQMEYI